MPKLHSLLILLFFSLLSQYAFSETMAPGDTINVPRISQPPLVDGSAADLCWDSAAWNTMPYVWIPYGATMAASDFTGRFKTVWNEQENLLYFLFEITDDKFVNGYVFSSTNGNYYLYDVVEIFIDENRSGGTHETTNNAFAYHITGGNASTDFDAVDMWKTLRVNYKDHFPEFARAKNGNVYTWEFSMMVLNDAYEPGFVLADFQSSLQTGKRMGFTAAYCDDDQSSSNPQRDNFIASKYLIQAYSNESYKNATHFGFMKLVNEPTANPNTSALHLRAKDSRLKVYPNPVHDFAELSFTSNYTGIVGIRIFNATGQVINKTESYKSRLSFSHSSDFTRLNTGMYFVRIDAGNEQYIVKVIR